MAVMIRTEGLAKSFGTTRALDGVDLEVAAGTVLGLLGPNGAGKTTAVRILATLLAPTAGHAQVGGYDVVRQPHQVRQLIGLTGQYAAVDESLSGTENLSLLGRLLGLTKAPAHRAGPDLHRRPVPVRHPHLPGRPQRPSKLNVRSPGRSTTQLLSRERKSRLPCSAPLRLSA